MSSIQQRVYEELLAIAEGVMSGMYGEKNDLDLDTLLGETEDRVRAVAR